ncbi:hypothetical protein BUALT_Bualt05G0105900 [Buddleja alternifolia]|uniref:RanBP2-type domain-containing protein n=1 Tax=Buddleja alternifolia TaxID=168488 RepID=A0AAV6XRM1_9LAMI|nr:hypothetical protein BUALT_Bualt05G0105900 [Buddleja alternifolia]
MFNPNFYLKTLKSQFQNPKFYIASSYIHNPTSKNPSLYNPAIQFILNEAKEYQSSNPQFNSNAQNEEEKSIPHKQNGAVSKIQISHPWREWVDLMEKLVKNGYFDAIGNPFANKEELGSKEANLIRTACLNFARDQYQLIRYLSRKDIIVIAGSGCPSTDRKVVNSGKRLRAHVGINEGNVCSSCILRGDCDRAYVKAREDEGGRTVDVMRFLLTYGLDPILGSVENKPCLNKRVKESVRTLLKEMVDIRVEGDDREPPKVTTSERNLPVQENDNTQKRSQITVPMKQGDWICPKCNFLNFARNFKCLRCDGLSEERLKRLAEEQEDLPLKKGDWKCDKCKFLNFARNTRCLMCQEKPPKRHINPGEWECDSCNYINFKRNMVCLKCDHRRPIASYAADIASQPVNNNVKNDSLKFVENEIEDHSSLSSWNEERGFMDFPIIGGKSDLSRDVQKQELWKMEMSNKNSTGVCAREDTGKYNNSNFHKKREYLAFGDDDDDDDEMAEWFEGRKKS